MPDKSRKFQKTHRKGAHRPCTIRQHLHQMSAFRAFLPRSSPCLKQIYPCTFSDTFKFVVTETFIVTFKSLLSVESRTSCQTVYDGKCNKSFFARGRPQTALDGLLWQGDPTAMSRPALQSRRLDSKSQPFDKFSSTASDFHIRGKRALRACRRTD